MISVAQYIFCDILGFMKVFSTLLNNIRTLVSIRRYIKFFIELFLYVVNEVVPSLVAIVPSSPVLGWGTDLPGFFSLILLYSRYF